MPIINIRVWLDANERINVLPTDKWYLDFAIKVYPLVKQSPLFSKSDQQTRIMAAVSIAMYFQDTIAQDGGWKYFSDSHSICYGTYLPFYDLTDKYVPDEVNKEDVAFVLWTIFSKAALWNPEEYTLFDPLDKDLLALSEATYKLMDESFEDAPICNEPSAPAWVMDSTLLDITATPIPEITPQSKLSKDVIKCLEYSQGESLLYFATYKELSTFFVDVLGWENTKDSLLPDLQFEKEFVIYANAKGMVVGYNIAACFNDARNPIYDAKRAAEESYKLFCQPSLCPFDLLKYAMKKELLTEAQLPFPNGKELLLRNWDFITRYYLCDAYEPE